MQAAEKTVFLDQEVGLQLLNILDEAKQQVVFVTPYLSLWRHLSAAIDRALKRGITITFIIRKDRNQVKEEDVNWLKNNRVKLYEVEGLHAKIYMNEKTLLVSSMNIYEYSTNNSSEIAVLIKNPIEIQQLRSYVSERLIPVGTRLDGISGFFQTINNKIEEMDRGRCIRCRKAIDFDNLKPLCDEHYVEWAKYRNPTYQERFCHSCGKEAAVSYERPLCLDCYKKIRR